MYQPAHPEGWCKTAACYGRYWEDVPGIGRQRRTVALGVCPTKTIARVRLREHLEKLGVNDRTAFHQNTAPTITFAQQAEVWFGEMKARRRKPVKPATLAAWRHTLDKWLLPLIGETRLAEVGNAAIKMIIDKMTDSGLSAKSIVSHSRIVKVVLASAVSKEGDELYPRKWNDEFCGMPIIDPTKQRRPTVTRDEVEQILSRINPRFRILVAMLAGCGLRIGEALGLKVEDLAEECRVLYVRRSVWHCQEQTPKTANAVRVVDLPEPLAEALREYTKDKSGLLFATRDGKPLSQRNVLRSFHTAGVACGFHGFRRFRTQTLRRNRVPEDLIKLWLGHANLTVTDLYAEGLRQDAEFRREWCDRIGLGFGLHGVTNVVRMKAKRAA